MNEHAMNRDELLGLIDRLKQLVRVLEESLAEEKKNRAVTASGVETAAVPRPTGNSIEEAFRAKERLAMAMESAGLAWWDHNFVSDRVVRSNNWAAMLGYSPEEIGSDTGAWRSLIHPDDLSEVEATARRHEKGETSTFEVEHRMRSRDGSWKWILNWGRIVERDAEGRPVRAMGTHMDITRRKEAELDREELIGKLETALAEIKTLRGIIPICAYCKKIRDDQGYWNQLETYIKQHSEAVFSHGICPQCLEVVCPGANGEIPGLD